MTGKDHLILSTGTFEPYQRNFLST